MKKYIGLQALVIGGMLALTGCGASNEETELETKTEAKEEVAEKEDKVEVPEKDKNRTEIQQVEDSEYQSIVRIDAPGQEGHGTGFLIGDNKLLTNKHVAESFDKNKMLVRVKNDSGKTFDYKVKEITSYPSEDVDLSIIEVSPNDDGQTIDDNIKHYEFASKEEIENVIEGDTVHTIGYPGDKEEGTLWNSEGKILMFGGNFLTYDAFISGGNSGSPLFNEDGKVIGLSNAGNDETEGNIVSFGFLLTDEIREFIENNR